MKVQLDSATKIMRQGFDERPAQRGLYGRGPRRGWWREVDGDWIYLAGYDYMSTSTVMQACVHAGLAQ